MKNKLKTKMKLSEFILDVLYCENSCVNLFLCARSSDLHNHCINPLLDTNFNEKRVPFKFENI